MIEVGSRVRTEGWADLRRQTGLVQQIDKAWAQVLWSRRDLGASWVALRDLIIVGEAGIAGITST